MNSHSSQAAKRPAGGHTTGAQDLKELEPDSKRHLAVSGPDLQTW